MNPLHVTGNIKIESGKRPKMLFFRSDQTGDRTQDLGVINVRRRDRFKLLAPRSNQLSYPTE